MPPPPCFDRGAEQVRVNNVCFLITKQFPSAAPYGSLVKADFKATIRQSGIRHYELLFGISIVISEKLFQFCIRTHVSAAKGNIRYIVRMLQSNTAIFILSTHKSALCNKDPVYFSGIRKFM